MTARSGGKRAKAGSVALMVALTAIPIIGLIALAVDFGMASVIKGKLDQAADSAALVAATAAANEFKSGGTDPAAVGIAAAKARFLAQSANQADVSINPVSVTMNQTGGQFTATVTYTALMPTTFARVVGWTSLPIGGQASSELTLNLRKDVQILMDVSSSMTIAASTADIARMQRLTATFRPAGRLPSNVSQGEACSFACHWSNTNVDYYQLAIRNNVALRITVLQSAVNNLIATMAGLTTNAQLQLGLYTFSQQFQTVFPLGPNIASATSFVNGIIPDLNDCSNNCPDTYFSAAMANLATLDAALPSSGPTAAQRFVFIVADGVYDQYAASGRQIGAFRTQDCDALKALGVSILVLYTPYLPIPTNGFYNQYVAPISGQIEPNLQACASSPSYYFVANDAADINNQLQNMFQLIQRTSSHLTN